VAASRQVGASGDGEHAGLPLLIVLRDVEPVVSRRVEIPGEASLAELHEVLQAAMGWSNSHLHEFDIDGARYGLADPDWDDGQVRDEAKTTLFRLVGAGGRSSGVPAGRRGRSAGLCGVPGGGH
jgi:hypothetical protein